MGSAFGLVPVGDRVPLGAHNRSALRLGTHRLARSVAVLVSMSGLLWGPAASALPLEDAVHTALTSHPSILAAQQVQRAAGQAVNIVGAGLLPTVDLRVADGWARTNNTTTRGRSSRGPEDEPQAVTLERFNSSLTISQMLFDGFATKSRTVSAQARLEGATFNVIGVSEAVALRAVQGYLNVVQGEALVGLARDYVAAYEQTVASIKEQVEGGTGTEADQAQAVGRLAGAEAALTQFEGGLADAQAAYREAVGDWPSKLVAPVVSETLLPTTVEDAVAQAVSGHPSLRAAADNIRSLESDLRAAGAPFLPRVTFDVTGTRNNNDGGVVGPGGDVTAMVTMTYNLFRGGADKAQVEGAKALLAEGKLRLDEQRRTIEQSVRVAFNAFTQAKQRLPQLEDAAKGTAQNREAFQGKFDLGQQTLIDRLTVEDQYFQANSAFTAAKFAVMIGHYQVLASLGRLRTAF